VGTEAVFRPRAGRWRVGPARPRPSASVRRIEGACRGRHETHARAPTPQRLRAGGWASSSSASAPPSAVSESWSPGTAGGRLWARSHGGFGTTSRRTAEWLERTPKYRRRCSLGGGTAATRRVSRSNGSSRSARVASLQAFLSSSSSRPSARRVRRSLGRGADG